MCITQEPTGIHVTHDMFDAVECDAGIGGIMHGENDAGDELNNQRNARENTEIPEIVQVPRDRVASTNGIIDQTRQRKAGIDPLHERSEEHTSELQSLMRISYAVCCLKKKKNKYTIK